MILWLKERLAGTLGNRREAIKKLPIIKQLNDKANKKLDGNRQNNLSECYDDIMSIIYSCNNKLDIWPDFGTLLGIYRNNGKIAHDIDMDFGLYINEFEIFKDMESMLLDKGFKKTREFYYGNIPVEFSYDYRGLNVDFVFYEKYSNYIKTVTISYLKNLRGDITNVESYSLEIPFKELTVYNYKGIKINIPTDTDSYLSCIYGENFMTPQTNYKWQENPNYKSINSDKSKITLM